MKTATLAASLAAVLIVGANAAPLASRQADTPSLLAPNNAAQAPSLVGTQQQQPQVTPTPAPTATTTEDAIVEGTPVPSPTPLTPDQINAALIDSNLLAPSYPSVSYEAAVGNAAAANTPSLIATSASAQAGSFDWSTTLTNLGEAAAVSALTGDPASIITAGISALVDFLMGGDGSGPTPEQQFEQDVENRLQNIQMELSAIETTLGQILQIDSQIQMDIQDAELNNVLTEMIQAATTIDNAFSQFATYAQAIASNTTNNATRAQAIQQAYTLLTTDPTLGPDAVMNAVTNYQRYALGFGGSRGVLSFVPQMVQNGWQACSMNIGSAAPNLNGALLTSKEPLRDNTAWAFHDSINYITKSCVNSTFSALEDQTGRSVQTVFGTILTEQLKAFALLSAAWGNNTLKAQNLQTVSKAATAIGSQMSQLWTDITVPATVDQTAQGFLSKYAETLGDNRANQYWWQFTTAIIADNVPPFSGIPSTFNSHFLTTTCQNGNLGGGVYPCLVDPATINFATGNTVSVPATAFTYHRDGANLQRTNQVLAPFCWCGMDSCDGNNSPGKCTGDFGPTAFFTGDFSNTDKNGNSCTSGWVPMCGIPNGKIEYIYDSGSTLTAAAPHTNIPAIPAFLSGISSAFAKAQ